jgi:hypothetical protein
MPELETKIMWHIGQLLLTQFSVHKNIYKCTWNSKIKELL